MKILFSILALSIILASCVTSNTVTSNHFFQKRKYTSGWNLNNQQREVSANAESIKENKNTDASLNSTINLNESTLNLIEHRSSIQAECDTIILNDGKIVRAMILSTSDSTIQYTSCESDDPSEFTMNKKEIKVIQYADGKFEFIKHQSAQEANKLELNQLEIDKKKDREAKEKDWMVRNNTNMTQKELKEKLKSKTRLVLIMGLLSLLCLILSLISVIIWSFASLPIYVALIFLVLAVLFLFLFISSIIQRQKEKEILLNGEKAK